jgi:D-amino-acid dehydrogenase
MHTHAVIIGAGAVGAACGFHALGKGHHVTFLEPGEPGQPQAASYGNAGWLSHHSILPPAYPGVWKQVPGWLLNPMGPLTIRRSYLLKALPWLSQYLASARTFAQLETTAQALRSMLKDAPQLHKEMAQAAGVSELINLTNILHVYATDQAFDREASYWAIRAQAGVTWERWGHSRLRQEEPDLSATYACGVLVDDTGYCSNPGRYVSALVADCLAKGAQWQQGQAVGFRFDGNRLKAVVTDRGEIACDKAIIAAGARGRELARLAGDEVPLATERGYHYVVHTHAGGPVRPTMITDHKVIVTPMQAGIRIAGQVEIAELDDTPNWQRAEILRQLLARLYPGIAAKISADNIDVWMGRRPSLPDGLPCIGPATKSADILHAYGHGHVGLAGSARTGRLVAQLLSGTTPEIDLRPFRAQRFSHPG